jgi:6-phosphogluconolactonase (cycloisomerase 2 family)
MGLLSAVCAGLIIGLAYAAVRGSWEFSEVAYAQARPRNTVVIERAPLRFIKDPYPSFSSVAVNSDANMLVVTDENLFQILEYDRRDNTPATARFTEPKRVISGPSTYAEMMCGVYIDPKTLEIYVVNNDTQNWMPVFSPDARGNAQPSRVLAAPHGSFAMAVDEEKQEMYITVQHANSVYVYRKQAEGEEKPLRVLQGLDTQLEDPHGLAIDTKNKLLFVANYGNAKASVPPPPGSPAGTRPVVYGKFEQPSITVYPLDASGNTKPLWTIEGPKTLMNWPSHLALHEGRQELFLANDADDSVLVFRATDKGDVAPIRVIKGPNTGIKHPPGLTLDTKLDELYIANMGKASVTVFPVTANGDVKPTRTIRAGPADRLALNIGNPGAVGYDTKRDQILVPN